MIFAHGSRFGGHTLFIKDHKLHYVYNFLGIKPEQKFVSPGTRARQVHARHGVHARDGAGEHSESLGTMKLYVNDKVVAEGPMRTQLGKFTLSRRRPVRRLRQRRRRQPAPTRPGSRSPAARSSGVGVDVGEDQYLDLEREAAAAFARD